MNIQVLNYIIICGAGFLLGGLSLWLKGNTAVIGKVTGLISAAEDIYKGTTKAGKRKFAWVVDQLYGFIPAVVRPFVPHSVIESLVQRTFDAVQDYAKMQLNMLAEKVVSK